MYNGDRIKGTNNIGRYCRSTVPSTLSSSANKMLVHFVSDAAFGRQGFLAEYSLVSLPGKLETDFLSCFILHHAECSIAGVLQKHLF